LIKLVILCFTAILYVVVVTRTTTQPGHYDRVAEYTNTYQNLLN